MKRRVIIILRTVALAAFLSACASGTRTVTVSAAASLTEAFIEIADAFEAENPELTIEMNLAGSGTLAAQIRQGAPVDVFASAAEVVMDDLQEGGFVVPGTRSDIASNQLVAVVARESAEQSGVTNFASVSTGPIAIGNPELVPAGTYARQSLQSMGQWNALQGQLVYGESVRQVLAWVEAGEVDMGFVYATDAQSSPQVRVVAEMHADSHQPIRYPIALIQNGKSPREGRQFVEFVSGPQGQAILARHGFATPVGVGS